MVYGVFSGCYSDWSVHGYFNSKEDADKYCCVCNKNGEYDNYYVKPLENLENEIDLSSISLKYCFYKKKFNEKWYKKCSTIFFL